jgi:hypothetical protein
MGREQDRAKVRSRVVISALGRARLRPSRVPAPVSGRLGSKKDLSNDHKLNPNPHPSS